MVLNYELYLWKTKIIRISSATKSILSSFIGIAIDKGYTINYIVYGEV